MKNLSRILIWLSLTCLIFGSCQRSKYERYTEVTYFNKLTFKWDNYRSEIVIDEDYSELRDWYLANKQEFIRQILNTSGIKGKVCDRETELTKGVFSFLFIDSVEDVKYFEVFEMQFDFFTTNCTYANGVIEYVLNNRKKAFSQLINHLSS